MTTIIHELESIITFMENSNNLYTKGNYMKQMNQTYYYKYKDAKGNYQYKKIVLTTPSISNRRITMTAHVKSQLNHIKQTERGRTIEMIDKAEYKKAVD